MKTITAKFNSKCTTTGQPIKRGERISYDPQSKKAYKLGHEPKGEQDGAMVQANEDAYFDTFCQANNI